MTERTTLTDCYVAFLDLMGVRKLSESASRDAGLCSRLIGALQETKNLSSFRRETKNVQTGEIKRWTLQVQAFSDCVVLFIPTESKMLAWMLASIRRLHDRLIRLNVSIRGGVTIGKMHWDQAWEAEAGTNGANSDDQESPPPTPIAFGPGLVAAFDLESGTAVYPRILISETLCSDIEKQRKTLSDKTFPLSSSGRLADFIRQDFDGLWHLDVLHEGINRRDVVRQVKETDEHGKHVIRNEFDETTYVDWLGVVKQFIETGKDSVTGEKLQAKYMWLATYYNEKAGGHSARLIPWFQKLVPKGAIKLTITQAGKQE